MESYLTVRWKSGGRSDDMSSGGEYSLLASPFLVSLNTPAAGALSAPPPLFYLPATIPRMGAAPVAPYSPKFNRLMAPYAGLQGPASPPAILLGGSDPGAEDSGSSSRLRWCPPPEFSRGFLSLSPLLPPFCEPRSCDVVLGGWLHATSRMFDRPGPVLETTGPQTRSLQHAAAASPPRTERPESPAASC